MRFINIIMCLMVCSIFVFAYPVVEESLGGEKSMTQAEQLVGRWKFVSLKGTNSTGEVLYPFGKDFFGMLMYDSEGYMSVFLMRNGRPKFLSGDLLRGTPEEIKAAFEGFDAYCGSYEVDTESRTVTHHIEGCRFPNWEGTDQVRYYEISEDQLRIKAPPIKGGGVEWILEAVLERQ